MDDADDVNILEWWKNSGLEIKYTYYAMHRASFCGYIEILEWWRISGGELVV